MTTFKDMVHEARDSLTRTLKGEENMTNPTGVAVSDADVKKLERLDYIGDKLGMIADKLDNIIVPYDLEAERREHFDQQHTEQMERLDHIADMLGIIASAIKETKNG